MYPGAHGPLSSLRLEAYRRGLEDRALLALLGVRQRAELTARLVRGPSNWTIDAGVMEQTRRDAAALIGARECPGPSDVVTAWRDSSLPLKADDDSTTQEPPHNAWSTDFMRRHGTDCGGADRSADRWDA